MDHAITAAVISIAAMPPTMIAPVLTSCACQPISSATVAAPRIYANDPPARGMPISRRRTRSGGTFDSANKGGKAKPSSISNPVAIAATAGARPGGGRSALTIAPSSITSNCWPPSATTQPTTLAANPRARNCSANSASICRCGAPRQRIMAAASRCLRRYRDAASATATAASITATSAASARNFSARSSVCRTSGRRSRIDSNR